MAGLRRLAKKGNPFSGNTVENASISVGAEVADVKNVAIQLKDVGFADLRVAGAVPFYLSSDSAGQAIASAPSGGIAIGTDGLMIEWTTNVAGLLISEADGDIDINFSEAGAGTWYLNLVMPDGRIITSGAITFA